MFPNGAGKPIGMQRVVQDIIRPALKGSGIEWHGWHALRRGLATNLYDLGVPDRIIQLAKTQRERGAEVSLPRLM